MQITERRIIAIVTVIALAMLAGCGGPPGIVRPDTPTRTTRIFTVTSPIEWARYRSTNAELWTIDGLALNRILWLVNIRDKYHVFGDTRATRRRPDGAFYRKGMDANEIESVLRDGMTDLGLINVKTMNLRPVKIGNFTAFRFDLSFDISNGLHYLGNMTFFERRGKLNLIWFSAPAEYYYPRDAEHVERLLASLQIRD